MFSFDFHLITFQAYATTEQSIYLYQDFQPALYQFLSCILVLTAQRTPTVFQKLSSSCFQTGRAFTFLLLFTFPRCLLFIILDSTRARLMSFTGCFFAKALWNLISKYPSPHLFLENHFSFLCRILHGTDLFSFMLSHVLPLILFQVSLFLNQRNFSAKLNFLQILIELT